MTDVIFCHKILVFCFFFFSPPEAGDWEMVRERQEV